MKISSLILTSTLQQDIKNTQKNDVGFQEFKNRVETRKLSNFQVIRINESLYFWDRFCVADETELKHTVLEEVHKSMLCILVRIRCIGT